jgi:hypothetical protein
MVKITAFTVACQPGTCIFPAPGRAIIEANRIYEAVPALETIRLKLVNEHIQKTSGRR